MDTSVTEGVASGSVVERSTRYCAYRAAPPIAPPPAIAVNAVHDASGDGVSPCRAKKAAVVPAGAAAVHDNAPPFTVGPASNARDVNVPAGRYGVSRTQSTATAPPPTLTSATI